MSDSDSSEEEDMSRFRDVVVDSSFTRLLNNSKEKETMKEPLKSERYLETASHYNDVKVPDQMQKQIGAKLAAVISKKIKFVEVNHKPIEHEQVEVNGGGIKLFKDSTEFLSCEEPKDTYTEDHNKECKKIKKKRRIIIEDESDIISEHDKLKAAAVSGDYVLSKEETKLWKSRRKEKLFKYKSKGKSKVLIALE